MEKYISFDFWDCQQYNDILNFFDDRGDNICSIDLEKDLVYSTKEEIYLHMRTIQASPKMLSLLRDLSYEIENPYSLTIDKLVRINKYIKEILEFVYCKGVDTRASTISSAETSSTC